MAINHLGTGFWVYSKLKAKVIAQGQRIDWFEDRNCKLKGCDKFHKSFEQVEKNISEQPEKADWSKEIVDYQVTIYLEKN